MQLTGSLTIVGTRWLDTDSIVLNRQVDTKRCFHRNSPEKFWTRWLTAFLLLVPVTAQAENGRVEGSLLVAGTARIETGVAEQCLDIQIEENVECYKDAIYRFLQSWVTAWGRGNIVGYLAHYAPGVSPDPDLNAVEWEEKRRKSVVRNTGTAIRLELETLMVDEARVAEVIFVQSCLSPSCSDPMLKMLSLLRSENAFKIQLEVKIHRAGVGIDTN
jgi:hypothetical protein